jgi:hypothetical protein
MGSSSETAMESGEVLDRLREVDPVEFEYFCADLWRRQGWEAEVTQSSRDAGVDIVMDRVEGGLRQKAVLQVKRYQEGNRVEAREVQQYNSLKEQEDADFSAIITTSGFTRDARKREEQLDVRLLNGADLVEVIDEADAMDLLGEYAPVEGRQEGADRRSEAERKVDGLGSSLKNREDSGDLLDLIGWKYVWASETTRKRAKWLVGIGAVLAFAAIGREVGAVWPAGLLGLVISIVVILFGGGTLGSRGRDLVEENRRAIYEVATEDIKESAKEKVGVTGQETDVHVVVSTGEESEIVDGPARYWVTCLVVDSRSLGIVEDAWIDVPSVSWGTGELKREFFYDQVTQVNSEDGELAIYLTDGSRHAWEAMSVSRRSIEDIRERIRAYK